MLRPIVALAAVALLLTGCAEQQPAGPPPTAVTPAPGSSPSESPTATPSTAPTAGSVSLAVHHGTPPATARRGPAWTLVTSDPSSSSVTIAWTDTPSPACGAVRDVWVRESGSTVVVDLVRSNRKAEVMCPAVLVPRTATVPLDRALGSRTLQQDATAPGDGRLPCPTPTASRPVACPLTPGATTG